MIHPFFEPVVYGINILYVIYTLFDMLIQINSQGNMFQLIIYGKSFVTDMFVGTKNGLIRQWGFDTAHDIFLANPAHGHHAQIHASAPVGGYNHGRYALGLLLEWRR